MKFHTNKSFSKSTFKLINIKNTIFLRKYFNKISPRDLESIIKQNNFKDYYIDDFIIKSAKIKTSYKIIKKKKYYDTFFYYGKSADEILQSGNIFEINFLRKWFKKIFFNRKIKSYYIFDNKIYLNKLEEISSEIKKKFFLSIFINKYIPYFKNKLKNNIIYYPKNINCHGDLTLSNLIINFPKKKLILFDFLKTYNDNIVQDYAKLFQEFKLGWSSRYLSEIESVRSSIVYKKIISNKDWNILDIKLKHAIIMETYMTLFRILPYIETKDKLTFNWIVQSLEVLKKISKGNL